MYILCIYIYIYMSGLLPLTETAPWSRDSTLLHMRGEHDCISSNRGNRRTNAISEVQFYLSFRRIMILNRLTNAHWFVCVSWLWRTKCSLIVWPCVCFCSVRYSQHTRTHKQTHTQTHTNADTSCVAEQTELSRASTNSAVHCLWAVCRAPTAAAGL